MSAASTRTTIAGDSTAMPAGATTMCCRISRRPKTSSAAPMIFMAPAVRCRCRICCMPIRCREHSSRRRSRPAYPTIPTSTVRRRKVPAGFRPRRGTADGRARRGHIFDPPRDARTCTSKPPRWRSASCSTVAAPRGSNTGKTGFCETRGRARKFWSRAARIIRRNCCSSPA